ncbi:protein serine/threonine phosphatase 2C [Mycena vitilis]|nr:protein serine/threonine phosphatase 2C [Mycena vitilis]
MSLDDARKRLSAKCFSTELENLGVHTVTFQPLVSRVNEDRVVTERWDIKGDSWLFLAVCDGHGGTTTAEYTASVLPNHIHSLFAKLDAATIDDSGQAISKKLKREVVDFDKSIGEDLRRICPDPESLTEEDARTLIDKHLETIERAYYGTTFSAATVINITSKTMWTIGVGDSTVGLSYLNADNNRLCQELAEIHSPTNPKEFFRVSMAHPSAEKRVLEENRVLNFLAMTRAIGDFFLKLHSSFTANLFRFVPTTFQTNREIISELSLTPPYLIARPSVKYTDLAPLWEKGLFIVLFSDGVDNLVDGRWVFHSENPCKADPLRVIADLLQDDTDPSVPDMLGHGVQPRWTANRALDVVGNLAGGTDAGRIQKVVDAAEELYIDDTSIIVFDVSQVK